MLYNTMHHRWMRIVAAIFGELLISLSGRLLIVPMGLYAGGLMGTCQLIRTFMQNAMGLSLGTYDIAGILYFQVPHHKTGAVQQSMHLDPDLPTGVVQCDNVFLKPFRRGEPLLPDQQKPPAQTPRVFLVH